VGEGLVDRRDRRDGAHAPGVRAGVAVADPLVVLRERERHRDPAVRDRERRDLAPLEELLDHHRRAGVAELASLDRAADGVLGRGPVGRDHDPLARREPVRLDDVRRSEAIERFEGVPDRDGGDRPAGRHPVPLAQRLRPGFRALEARPVGAGTEDAVSTVAKDVGESRDERPLGSDHGEIDAPAPDEVGDRVDVGRLHGDALGLAGDAGVPGRGHYLVDRRAPRERP
jgi:hypothetical protein